MFDVQEYFKQLADNTVDAIQLIKESMVLNITMKDGQWSILEIAEHICIVDKTVIAGMMRNTNLPGAAEEIIGKEKLNKIIVELRARKVVAPAAMNPVGAFTTFNDFEEMFLANRNKLIKLIADKNIIIDARSFPHPYLGEMSMSDWCYFLIAHTNRHCLQIQDMIKA
jgi:DinB superfamily